MKKPKVLLVHNFYQIGGGEHTVFENEKKMLIDNGHEIIQYTRNNKEIKNIIDKILLPIITIFNFRTYFEVKKLIKEESIEIVHCHNTFPLISPSVYYAANKCNVPVVQTLHNFRLLCPNGILYTRDSICEDCLQKGIYCAIQRKCYRNSKSQTCVVVIMLWIHRKLKTYIDKVDKYILLTEFNMKKMNFLIPEDKMFIKPNFSYSTINTFREDKKESFVFVGRLEKSKGILFLLDAWKSVKNERLIIVGDGTLTEYVKKTASEHENICFVGTQSHEEVIKLINCSKSLIFPSEWYEGFPMVLLEAMSQGVPVITSDVGNGASIVLDDFTGLHYRLNDINHFISQIYKICDNKKYLSLGKNAKKVFEENYSSTINYKLLYKLYKEVMKNESD